MLTNHTLERLQAMKLTGMADAFRHQLEQPTTHELAFSERFALLVDAEATYRENERLTRLLQLAHLKQPACVEDIDYKHKRGLDRAQVAQLATCQWIRARTNLHITGATGNGKLGSRVPSGKPPVGKDSRSSTSGCRAYLSRYTSRAAMVRTARS